MDKKIAVQIYQGFSEVINRMDKLLFDVKGDLDQQELLKLKRTVAKVIALIDTEVTVEILDRNPDLD